MFPVDAFRATLTKVIGLLEKHEIRFHLTGGVASIAYGEPRLTQDVDIVIDNGAIGCGKAALGVGTRVRNILFENQADGFAHTSSFGAHRLASTGGERFR